MWEYLLEGLNKMYYAQFELDKFLNDNYIQNKKDGFYVESGAYDGIEESTCLFFELELGWNGINIEPVPFIFDQLIKNRPNSINLDIALYNKAEKKEFTHIIHPERGKFFGNGSLKHSKEHMDKLVNKNCTPITFLVQCYPFKTVWDKLYKNKKEIDLFVLDIEGGELEAISGILKIDKKYYPKIFCIEHSHVGFDNIENILRKYYDFSKSYYHNSIFIRKF